MTFGRRLAGCIASSVAGARWDSGVESGSEVGPEFDGLLAKGIAHATTREEAAARLVRALRGAQVQGLECNRDALVAILESVPFLHAGDVSTDFLARHPELLEAARRTMSSRYTRWRRSWWRASVGTRRGECCASYRRGGATCRVGEPEPAPAASAVGDDWVDLEVDGVQARFEVHAADGAYYVNGLGWQTRHTSAPRFGSRDAEPSAREPTAPLPGTVVAVLVAPGERVHAGQSLVVLDAMKIEHHVAAETDGEVVDVRVHPGQRVDAHEVLVVLGP